MTEDTRGDRPGQNELVERPDPHSDPARWSPRLERLVEEQRRLVEQLDALGIEQRRLIDSGEGDELVALLSRRQSLTDQVARLSQEFEPFRRDWGSFMERLPTEQRERLSGAVAEIGEGIRRITERDDADRQALQRQRDVVTGELASVSKARGAVAAYGRAGGAGGGPRYQDRKG